MTVRENDIFLQDSLGGGWLHFSAPVAILTTRALGDVQPLLRRLEQMTKRQGLWAAGFLTYEAAPAFDPALATHAPGPLPLLWFGLYTAPRRLPALPETDGHYVLGPWQPQVTRSAYLWGVDRIKAAIARGESYQANYTWPLAASFEGEAFAYFRELNAAQAAHFGAYVDTGRFALCSASPELFFTRRGTTVTSRPMKGTAARGLTLAEDDAQAAELAAGVKNRAENVMIVDMIRNDLGRVAVPGSVHVPALFATERYPTLWQMTSTVTATTDAALTDLLQALFPCASITGAPKVRTMALLRELEPEPRGVYTGAIGYVGPDGTAQFNVAIRTVVIDRQNGSARYGVGSGIVWDSDPAAEYEECRMKARVLTERLPPFDLLETLRWSPDEGFFLLERHLTRLRESAIYFGRRFDETGVRAGLARLAAGLPPRPHRVRLLVGVDGIRVAAALLGERAALRAALAPAPIDRGTSFLYHKTTHRPLYDAALANRPEADDVLLWNAGNELTEFCFGNVVLELDGARWTPPVASGLLAGTYRAELLERGEIGERVLTVADLAHATGVWRINSVGGWQAVVGGDWRRSALAQKSQPAA